MQNSRGYCGCCCVFFSNLEQHLDSAQHRYVVALSRRRLCTNSLMERFLEDVMHHHPYYYHESRLMQNERVLKKPDSSSELIYIDDVDPEEITEDGVKIRGNIPTEGYEPNEKLYSWPTEGREYTQCISERPSVIKKLDRGKYPFGLIHKLGSNTEKFTIIGVSETAESEQNLACPRMTPNAPSSYLREGSYDRAVMTNPTKLPQISHLDYASKYNLDKVDRNFEQLGGEFGNPMLSSNLDTSSDSEQNLNESNRGSSSIRSNKLIVQDDIESQGSTLSTDLKFHKVMTTEDSRKSGLVFKMAAKPNISSSKTSLSSFNKGIFDDAIPKHLEKLSSTDCIKGRKHLFFNKSVSSESRNSLSSEVKFDRNFFLLSPNQSEVSVQDLWRKEQNDQEVKSYVSRDSEISFDCNFSFHSPKDQSKMTVEIDLTKEVDVDFQCKNSTSCISEVSSDCSQLASNEFNVSVKNSSVQKAIPISLVDESYDSNDSEMNFDCEVSYISTDDYHQRPEKNVNISKEVQQFALVDMNYGSSSSEVSANYEPPFQSLVDRVPQAVTEIQVQKKGYIGLVSSSYESDCSEASIDGNASPKSVIDHSQLTVKERNLKKGHIALVSSSYDSDCSETSSDEDVSPKSVIDNSQLTVKERTLKNIYRKDRNHCGRSINTHLDRDVSIVKVTDEPHRDVDEVSILEGSNDVVTVNCESHDSEMNFHTRTQLMNFDCDVSHISTNDYHQQPEKKVNIFKKVHLDLVDMNYGSSNSEVSIDSDSDSSCGDSPWVQQSQVTHREMYTQEEAIDLENKSVKPNVDDPHFDSQSSLYQSASDQREGTLGKMNVKESNVDAEVKSWGCSSSELTFESDPSYVLDTELDIEGTRRRHNNLGNSYESASSEVTFESNVICTAVEQPEETVNEESFSLENKTDTDCIYEISSDSDISFYSETNQSELADKEMTIQKEGNLCLGGTNELSDSEGSMRSCVSPHSTIISQKVVAKKLNLEKDNTHPQNNTSGPTVSELSYHYDLFRSMTTHSEDTIKGISLQRDKNPLFNVDSENEGSGLNIATLSVKSNISPDNSGTSAKEINYQEEEHVNFKDKNNELSVFKRNLYHDIPLQSLIQKPQVAAEEIRLQKEKCAKDKEENAETSVSSEVPYSVTESQIAVKETQPQKEVQPVESKSLTCRGANIISESSVFPRLKIKMSLLKKAYFDPNNENTEARDVERNVETDSLHTVIDQPQPAFLKEKHVDKEDRNSKPNECKTNVHSDDSSKSLTEQVQGTVKKTIHWKKMKRNLINYDEPVLHHSNTSLQSVAENSETAVKRIRLESEGHVNLKDKNSNSDSTTSSDFSDQARLDQPRINFVEPEHIEPEDKHNQPCGSEISFDSDDPVQSVTGQLRETIKDANVWKDEVAMKENRDGSRGFESVCDSDVLQSESNQTEKITKETNIWETQNDLENKIVEPECSVVNPDSNELFQSTTTEIQENITETNLAREECVYLEQKSDSEVIYVSNVPLQSMDKQSHVLEEEYINLDDENYDPGCELSFVSDSSLQSVVDHHQTSVKKTNHWKEDHVYLENKRYKLGDSEVTYDSGIPIHFVTDQFPVPVKEIDVQERDHNDLENANYGTFSEIKCSSGVCLQVRVDEPQVICRETNLHVGEHLGMEEMTEEPSGSGIMSDGLLQIVVDHNGVSFKEASQVDLVSSDSDCEIISDSDTTFQPVIDSPQMIVKGVNCINSENFYLGGENCGSNCSEIGYTCEASPGSLAKQPKSTFKVVTQKKDYIILQESSCESYGSEINIQIDPSPEPVSYQSQVPHETTVECVNSEDKNCESSQPEVCKEADNSQPVTDKPRNAGRKAGRPTKRRRRRAGARKKTCRSRASTVNSNSSPAPTAGKGHQFQSQCSGLESMSCEPCGSSGDFQRAPSLQFDANYTQKGFGAVDQLNTSVGLEDAHSVPAFHSMRNLRRTKRLTEGNVDEPVLEALPHVPPSFVGKTWSQIMREDDVKINNLVREFREGRFHCYFDDDCETREVKKKKKNLNEKTHISWADTSQDTAAIQIISDFDDNSGGISDSYDISAALDKRSHHSPAKMPYAQPLRVNSRGQTVKVSHGTQTNLMSHPKTKIIGQVEDLLTRKPSQKRRKKKVKAGMPDLPKFCTQVVKPLEPDALLCIVSNIFKLMEGVSFNLSKMRSHNRANNKYFNKQYKYKNGSFNYYDPMHWQIVINPPPNIEAPKPDRDNWVNVPLECDRSEDGDLHLQNSLRSESRAHEWDKGSNNLLEKSEILNSSKVSKENALRLSFSNCDVVKISLKSDRARVLKRKKAQKKKLTTIKKPDSSSKDYKLIILQQQKRTASVKQSIWIQTKASAIIRKYISKYSAFLRHKYQYRSTFTRIFLKKKSAVSRLKKVKKPAKMLSNTSVPPTGVRMMVDNTVTSLCKQPVQNASRTQRSKRNGKKRHLKKKKKPSRPAKIYALRSICPELLFTDKVVTRLSVKSQRT